MPWHDEDEPFERSKFLNPPPPPGYVGPDPRIVFKPGYEEIDGELLKFLALVVESGVLDDSDPLTDFEVQTSDEDEVVPLSPVSPKVPPLIDLEAENPDISDGEIPGSPEDPLVPEPVTSKKVDNLKNPPSTAKDAPPPPAKRRSPQPTEKGTSLPTTKVKKLHNKDNKKLVDYNSDSSTESSNHSKKKKNRSKLRRRSRSSDSDRNEYSDYVEPKYNPALVKEEGNIYGHYNCRVCKLTMNSAGTYFSHLAGKRHLKAVKQQNVAQTVSDSITSCVPVKTSRYPVAPPNVVRLRISDTAVVQDIVEKRLKSPCPGLDKVIEIQGLEDTHYYCELCDAPCTTTSLVPHLQGRKHQFQCLKRFNERAYDRIKYKSNKIEVDQILREKLSDVEKSKGRGRITVEKEVDRQGQRESYSNQAEYRVPRIEDIAGPSHRYFDQPEDRWQATYKETTIPDMSKSDYYCKICDSHMNNLSMWKSHTIGKRHLKNLKKAPGEAPSKTKSLPLPNARAYIMDEIDEVAEPVVGLKFIRETRNPEVGGALYNCFLCGASLTHIDIVDHVLSQKHRTKFLERIEHPYMLTISQMNIQESRLGSIIEETAAEEERMNGRGVMEVHVMKNAVARW